MPRTIEVLIVEDNPGDVRLIREGIKRANLGFAMNVRVAVNGEEALQALLDEENRPDIVLLDLSLPKIHGQTVLQIVRSRGITLKSTPIVVFSSSQHDIQEILDSGANCTSQA